MVHIQSLSKNSNSFFINRSQLIGRFDAPIYRDTFSLESKVFPMVKLSEIIYINPNTSFNKLDAESLISFVPMEAVDDKNGTIRELYKKKVKDSKGFTRFQENDLIWAKITPCMQNGKSAIVRNTLNGYACGSTEFFVLRPKSDNIIIEYIHYILRDDKVLQHAMNYFGGSAGQQRVSKDFLYNFKVSLPPIEIQSQIVDLISKSYSKKRQNESDANDFQRSINDYILNELGINIIHSQKRLEERIFLSRFSDVVGLRFDPAYFNNASDLKSKNFENNSLRKLATITKGQSITKEKISEGEYPVIAGGQSSPYSHNVYNYSGDVITVSASGAYSGYVWYHDYPIFASDCNVIQSKDNSIVSTLFLYYVLKAQQDEIYKLQQGAGQPHVYARDLEKVNIPLPKSAKQTEMLNHIKSIEEEIKKLRFEALQNLEHAKNEVEKLIIG